MTPAPAEIAARALGSTVESVVAVERIKHGLTNQSWRVRTASDAVVVRISTADEDALRIDRESEARILAVVAAAGIGAQVLCCDPARHILVTRYIGPSWSFDDAATPGAIERLAQLLRRLHETPAPPFVREVDLSKTFEGYIATLTAHGAGGELASATLQRRAAELAALLRRNARPALCHNDVHHLNIVDGEGLRLIDWEYSGLGEPLFDLASVCVYHRYARAERAVLLAAYAGARNDAVDARLDAALWLFEYIRDLWLAVRAYADRS
jgi:thiamine kinase-like enzyme